MCPTGFIYQLPCHIPITIATCDKTADNQLLILNYKFDN